ncbi:MAG: glycosyl transferase, partial [Thermosynechococcaceae cyanobacterium]
SAYLMKPPPIATLRDQLSEFAIVLKNRVRPLGMETLGWPCLLTGSGMAFPWTLIQSVSLAGSINADDMQLTIDFALQGVPPVYEPQSRVTGRMMAAEDATSQRSRWENGHLKVIAGRVPALLGLALQLRRFDLFILALDVAIPPLALLIWLWLGISLLELLMYGIGIIGQGPLYLGIGAGGLFLLSIFLSWKKFGQTILPRRVWLQVPRYLLWKLPIYLRFIAQPQPEWITTERDKTKPADSA